MFVSSDNNTVVVDVGSETFKIGYSNRDVPLMFDSTYTTKNNFKSPVNCSVIEDYQSYFTIISNNIPSDTCYLLIAENTFENDEHRAKLLSDLMENNMCDSLFFGKSAILDAFSYGKTNALVIVLSGGTTQAVAVLDGFIVSRKKIDYGCSNISRKFQEKLEKNIDFSEKINLSKDIKNYESLFEFKKFEFSRFSKEEFYLKWKKSYEKKNTINYSSCDFNIEQQFLSIHSKIFDVVDLVKEIVSNLTEEKKYLLLNNIVISGGGSLIPFISEVLEKMLSEKLKTSKVRIANNSSRFHTFFGGCILSNIGLVKTLQIGKLDYKEYGSSILDRKKFNWII